MNITVDGCTVEVGFVCESAVCPYDSVLPTPVTWWSVCVSDRRGATITGTADSFSINTAENEIGYQQFPPGGGAGQSLYWALPGRLFLGNRVSVPASQLYRLTPCCPSSYCIHI